MMCAIEMVSCGKIHIPNFLKIGTDVKQYKGVTTEI
jgi:hypothetical protein